MIPKKDYQILKEQSLRVTYSNYTNQYEMKCTDELSQTLLIAMFHERAKMLLEATVDYFDINSQQIKTWLNQTKFRNTLMDYFLQHRLSPYTELYLEFIANITEKPIWNEIFDGMRTKNKALNLLKKQVIKMRAESHSADFKKKIKSVQRSVNKNRQNLLEYFHNLFKQDNTILILRLNLGYSEEEYKRQHDRALKSESRGLKPLSNARIDPTIFIAQQLMSYELPGFSLEDVVLHREELIRHLRSTLKQNLRGYTWKLDYTLHKGYQYHVIIFLDATLAQASTPYDKTIGAYWENVITQGHGLCYIQNENKKSYRFCATGMKTRSDPELDDDLAKMADYLTRPDLYAQLVLPGNQRTLGKGVVSTKKNSPKKRTSPQAKNKIMKD